MVLLGNLKVKLLFSFCLVLLISCEEVEKKSSTKSPVAYETVKVERPFFSSDSAYAYIQKQVDFGPRVPNTANHVAAGNYLSKKLGSFNFEIIEQIGQVEAFDGKKLNFKNVIGAYKKELNNRILLFAHWDTRPFADQGTERVDKPILGANDGASGVGVLLEIARQINIQQPNIGVDIIFFDAEDYGEKNGVIDTWCLGSQYWSKNKHESGYSANFGILLDMVGAKDAMFTKESISMENATAYVNLVWNNAEALGHQKYFNKRPTRHVGIDDHYYVNTIAKIPSIDIIQYDPSTRAFAPHWHTHDDNMDVIDKNTLQAVGETVLATVIQEGK